VHRGSKEMIISARTSWEDVFEYFIFATSQVLGMVEVQIKSDLGECRERLESGS